MTTKLPDIPFSSFLYVTIMAHLIFVVPLISGVLLFDLMNVKTLLFFLAVFSLTAIPISTAIAWLIAKGSHWENTHLAVMATCGLPARLYGVLLGSFLGTHLFGSIGGIIGAVVFYFLAYFLTSPLGKFIASKVMPEAVLQKS